MKNTVLISILATFIIMAAQVEATTYKMQSSFEIDNSGNSAQFSQAIPITLNVNSFMLPDRSDIIFSDTSDMDSVAWNHTYDSWIDRNANTSTSELAYVRISVAALSKKTIYMYSGNKSTITLQQNGNRTFDGFEDWCGISSNWTDLGMTSKNSYTIDGNCYINLNHTGGSWAGLVYRSANNYSITLQARIRLYDGTESDFGFVNSAGGNRQMVVLTDSACDDRIFQYNGVTQLTDLPNSYCNSFQTWNFKWGQNYGTWTQNQTLIANMTGRVVNDTLLNKSIPLYNSKADLDYLFWIDNPSSYSPTVTELLSSGNAETNIYEVKTAYINTSFNISQSGTVSGFLHWNGTRYAITSSTNTTPTSWTALKTIIPNFTIGNITEITYFWNLTYAYDNGTTAYNQLSSTGTQDLLWSYAWSAPQGNITSGIAGQTIATNATLNDIAGVSTITLSNESAIFNGTLFTPSQSGTLYSKNFVLPTTSASVDKNFYYSLLLTYADKSIIRNSTSGTVTVNVASFGDCSSGYRSFRFDIFDENNQYVKSNLTFDATIKFYATYPTDYQIYNVSYAMNTTHFICISQNTSVTIDMDARYGNDSYPYRYYFLRKAMADNNTQQINIYILNDTFSSNIQFQVTNANGKPESDILLNVQRWYESEGLYKNAAMGLTDDGGYTNIGLRPYDTYYRIIASRNGTIIKTFSPTVISSSANILAIPSEIVGDYWKYHNQIASSCSFANNTGVLRCDGVVQDGTSLPFHLEAWEVKSVSQTQVCDETGTSSAVTLLCTLGNVTGKTIRYMFWVDYPSNDDTLITGTIEDIFNTQYGTAGLLFTVMFVMALTFTGLYNPAVALMFSALAIIVGMSLNMISISLGAAVSIILIIIIVIWRTKT